MAVTLGLGLTALHLTPATERRTPPVALRIAHGIAGAGGLAALAWVLPGVTGPSAAFATYAAVALCIALAAGLAIPLLILMRRCRIGLALAVHGSIAVIGYVLLMAYLVTG